MVEQKVKGAHIAMIREAKVLDAPPLTLLQQEVQQAIVQETAFQRIHTATADAVQQVIVDMIHLQALKRLLIHPLTLVEAPQVLALVRHLRSHIVLLSGMTRERVTRQHLRLATHIHRCCIEVIHAVLDGIVHQLVHLILIVRQTHHTKAQERNLLARAVLHTIRHTTGSHLLLVLCEHAERLHHAHTHNSTCAHSQLAQKLSAAHLVPIVLPIHHICLVFSCHLRVQR